MAYKIDDLLECLLDLKNRCDCDTVEISIDEDDPTLLITGIDSYGDGVDSFIDPVGKE